MVGVPSSPVLRVARPTDDIDSLRAFYIDGLGFDILYEFVDRDGFDGLIVGQTGAPYHLEFVSHRDHPAGRAPTLDNLLVFYIPERADWRRAVARMEEVGFAPVKALNRYWDRHGVTFEDPDGYRMVLQNAQW